MLDTPRFVNIFDQAITITATPVIEAIYYLPFNLKDKQYLSIGQVFGYEDEFQIGVHYIVDKNANNSVIVVDSTAYAYQYKPLIGQRFANVEELRKNCLTLYTPTHLAD